MLHLEDAQGNAEEDNLIFKILVSHESSVPHDDDYDGSNLQDLHQKSRHVPVLQGTRGGKALNLRSQANLAIIIHQVKKGGGEERTGVTMSKTISILVVSELSLYS